MVGSARYRRQRTALGFQQRRCKGLSGGLVSHVEKGGPADRLGILPEDRLVSINGHLLRDIIDYHFYAADERLELEIERAGKRLAFSVDREYGEEFGLRFAEDVFDGIRRCGNRCEFCFVNQMPPGLRPSLYVKDDDYRYSFLHGNFITLSNWTEADWERVAEQHLSPLYVSVHATEPELRQRLLCNPGAPDILDQLGHLTELDIAVHTQIVVVPGMNDGDHLERTVQDLTALYPGVASIGVVPVGLTRYHRGDVRPLTVEEVGGVLDQLLPRQGENRERLGVGLVYPSDELFMRAGYLVPPAEEYDGFPQLENGIGLVRGLLDEWEKLKEKCIGRISGRGTVVCGTLIAPLMTRIAADLSQRFGAHIAVRAVENGFFGESVTVSGLLTGGDVMDALKERDLGEVVFLPRAMFEVTGESTLDDVTIGQMQDSLGVRVVKAGGLDEMLRHLEGRVGAG
jgi:putative radical SAM enzyme (TIGR03279 family)